MSPEPQPAAVARRRRLRVLGVVALLGGAGYLLTDYGEEEKALRVQLREAVEEAFPEEASEYRATVGLERLEPEGHPCGERASGRAPVVLVHGLDDPGLVWRNLAPALCEQAFDVWRMEYPNDQPIADSARLLAEELKQLEAHGIDRVAIVAHSMGGLVAREMLTSPDTDYPALARQQVVPQVGRLILVGTPNHGSPMARFRLLAEWRDQLSRLAQGEARWLGGILDGAGEAQIDLLPDSRFLAQLNQRPHPEGVDMLVIAGVASPWSEADVRQWIDDQSREAGEDQRRRLAELRESLVSLTRSVGDGLVSLESARLEGVELQTVDGTHLTMIRNLTSDSERVPPAVPIILERLRPAGAAPSPDD